jgi:cytochrome c553
MLFRKTLSWPIQELVVIGFAAFTIFLVGVAQAQDSGTETKAGETAAPCAACHGEKGIPIDKSTPVIWGQNEGYLYLQLRDYKSGARKNNVMAPIAQALQRDDMLTLAQYFSSKRWPQLGLPSAPADVVAKAARANNSIGCTGCHQSEYQGEGTQPRLAGQWREYLESQMLAFRNGSRGNNPGMSDLMKAASKEDIAAMAQYLAGQQYMPGQ